MRVAKPDETEEMYQKNLKFLAPWIQNIVTKISDEEAKKKVVITYNEEGLPVCLYRQNGACFHITSEHPMRETEVWEKSVQPQDSAEIFLYGSGFGYPLFELFAHKPDQTLVVVFEQDICLFKAMLYYFDFSPLFNTQKLMFFIGNVSDFEEEFSNLFCRMLFFFTAYPTILFTFPATRNFKAEYLEIHRYIIPQLSYSINCLGNSHQDDMTGLHNLLANANEVLKSPYLSCMKDRCHGVPAVIVSNGPSLDKSMPLLKKIQGKCLMICAESAIVPLTKSGIKPDIMAALERTKVNYHYHFENRNHSPDISLFALAMVDPRSFPSFAGEKIPIFRQGEGLNMWFNEHLGDGSSLNAGASVAHLAASAAIYLGADPIIFVGQDFAYGPDGATHSKDAVASQEQGKRTKAILHAYPTVYVEGNNEKTILSNQLWLNFRTGMEKIITEHPEHHFYNATAGGAKIKGTEWVKLDQLIKQYCAESIPFRVRDLIAEEKKKISVTERAARLKKLIVDVRNYVQLFRNVAHETNLKKLKCEKMMFLCAGKNEEKYRKILDATYRENLTFFYRYMDDSLCNFFFQRMLAAYFYLFSDLGAIDTQEKRVRIFDLHRQLFRDLRIISQSLAVTFEESVQPLETLMEELQKEAV